MAGELTGEDLARRQQEKRRAAASGADASSSAMARLAAAKVNAGNVAALADATADMRDATNGASTVASNGATAHPVGPDESSYTAPPPPVKPPATATEPSPPSAPTPTVVVRPSAQSPVPFEEKKPELVERRTIRQGATFLADDFEQLQDIVHQIQRRYKLKNPLGAKLGASHLAGALVHHMLPMWETDRERFVQIFADFMKTWAGEDAP